MRQKNEGSNFAFPNSSSYPRSNSSFHDQSININEEEESKRLYYQGSSSIGKDKISEDARIY